MESKRFSPTRVFSRNNIAKVPKGKPIVYKIKNTSGINIYTGSAKRGRSQERLKDHLSGGPHPIPSTATFQVKTVSSIKEAQAEENRIIEKEKPRYNKRP